MARVSIRTIRVSDGTIVSVPKDGLVVFVGPNNAGKSRALKDIREVSRSPETLGVVVRDVKLLKSDEPDWIPNRISSRRVDGRLIYDVPGWGGVALSDIESMWLNERNGLQYLTDLFFLLADGTSRLTAGSSQPSFDVAREAASAPLHRVYVDPELEEELDRLCQEAFNLELSVDRFGGNMTNLRAGVKPTAGYKNSIPTKEYLSQLKEMSLLEEQGDGVRAYVGLLLLILAGSADILLIDEPEAFLHPPQARLLGRVLGDKARGKQGFIATHSTDFLQGVLSSQRPTKIVRITRDGDINHASVLGQERLKELWSDSLLRHSNVLDGLFHDAVVICESDSDCMYYSAVMEHLPVKEAKSLKRPSELLFTYSSTKSRMAVVASALRAVQVPVVVVGDFDLLRKEPNDLQKLVKDMGGNYENFRSDHEKVAKSLEPIMPLSKIALKDAFNFAIDEIDELVIDDKAALRLRKMVKGESGWDKAKKGGIAMVGGGDARKAADRLIAGLKDLGILIVEVGEVEGFVPQVGGHGPKWVAAVLADDLHRSPNSVAADFVDTIRETAEVKIASMLRAEATVALDNELEDVQEDDSR